MECERLGAVAPASELSGMVGDLGYSLNSGAFCGPQLYCGTQYLGVLQWDLNIGNPPFLLFTSLQPACAPA